MLVLHYTGMPGAAAATQRLRSPTTQVSAHYVVDEDGSVTALVEEENCAWHAGVSAWRGMRGVNRHSVGIEIVNPGHEWGYRPFPIAQMEAVVELSRGIIHRHGIAARDVVGHSDVAPQRKEDPGELFNWRFLAGQGVGVWPEVRQEARGVRELGPGDRGEAVMQMQDALATYGYDVPQHGTYDEATRRVAVAFQRHFRAGNIAGMWDGECAALLRELGKIVKV